MAHQQRVAYYSQTLTYPDVPDNRLDNEVLAESKGDVVPSTYVTTEGNLRVATIAPFTYEDSGLGYENGLTVSLKQYIDFGTGQLMDTEVVNLSKIFGDLLETLKAGDHVWIDSRNSNGELNAHSFFVVGWGEMNNCNDVIERNKNIGYSELAYDYNAAKASFTDLNGNVLAVPYIVDFSMVYINMQPTFTQLQSPRPFYCSRYPDPYAGNGTAQYFNHRGWYFFSMLDKVEITNLALLYATSNWHWTDTDGAALEESVP